MIAPESDAVNENMKRAKETIEKYFFQLTQGCGKQNCLNLNCASNPNFEKLNNNQAAALAIRLAKLKPELCHKSKSEADDKMDCTQGVINNQIDEDNVDFYEDDDDIVLSKNSSTVNLRASSATSTKSINDALQDAVKYVTEMSQKTSKNDNQLYLSENRLVNLIKKCKYYLSVDKNTDKDHLACYAHLFSVVQRVFQSYKALSQSFTFKNDTTTMSSTMPSIPPFNIDFNSLRRSYSLLFSLSTNEKVIDELEKEINLSVYALCVAIRMNLKKQDLSEEELNEILHALLVVNELPILEDPRYMDRCAKIFYATLSELSVKESAKIVQLWSKWHADELKIFLNKAQQYITVEVISKNFDEENNEEDEDEEDDEDEHATSKKKLMYKNEGITGGVNYLRLIYYASILGGRLDPEEQIRKEHQIEQEEINLMEATEALEENGLFRESFTYFEDPLEKVLNIRSIDCREPKIPYDQFLNDVANKYIDINYDYVEYRKQMLYAIEQGAQGSQTSKKQIFSFLSYPFFVDLTKKNFGLFYDNKLKMRRERTNNFMLSILEGRMPTPYFKMRLSRQNLLAEALNLIELQEQENPATLRKQLFIEFENEQGIDQGGVSKEFFQLAIDELLNKGYTFFTFDNKSNYYWFTPCTIETEKEFTLVGILFSIAIYNNVLSDVQFPPVFFRKLLGKLGTFEDLLYSHPDLHKSLTSILEFDGSEQDFEDTFMLKFQISLTDNFGSLVNFNLKENGDSVTVTKENRAEFADLYADFMLNKGIEQSFKAFRRGFMKLTMHSPLAKWYTPQELEILLCGTTVMDWKSLKDSTIYDSGFDRTSKYINEFWEVFEEFTDEEKKLFLKFTTGTDRCPHGGLSELKLTFARNGPDTEKLPTAHTCFNVLLLPEYSSRQKLKEKLIKAIQYSRGFGLS